jgi:hypothetical protein
MDYLDEIHTHMVPAIFRVGGSNGAEAIRQVALKWGAIDDRFINIELV